MSPSEQCALSFKEAYEMLVKPDDGPVSKHVNRHISIRISLLLIRRGCPISPNGMSLLSFSLALVGALSFTMNWPFLGGLLAQLASILDGCDGEIARLTGRESKKGAFIDAVLDRIADIALVSALGIFAYLAGPPPCSFMAFVLREWASWPLLILVLTFMALSGSQMVSYCAATIRALSLGRPRRLVGSRDVRLFILMLAGITCQFFPRSALGFLATLALFTWIEVARSSAHVIKFHGHYSIDAQYG